MRTLVYDGSFELSFLRADESVGSAGEGDATITVEGPWGQVRVEVGDRISRTRLGRLTVLSAVPGDGSRTDG